MTPMHQPTTELKRVNHAITLDATDVEITKFVEHMDCEWFGMWQNLLNFSNVRYDLGHDTLTFTTECVKLNLVKMVTKLSCQFPKIFFMYDFYTDVENEEDMEYGTFYLYGGKVTIDQNELEIEHEV